ncbi:short chain dehydrogenase reductase [Xylariaceae sp. FL0016]|nr:short chain dehydrogenase reductase [Xylariaceae sp. FL0016]
MSHHRKVALVTAGSAGLGAAIARLLARDLGMSVIINYHANAARAESLVADLQSQCGGASSSLPLPAPVFRAVQADISSRAGVAQLVEAATAATGGRLDVVVSNVGWTRMRDFADLEDGVHEEDWDRCFGANVKAHLWLFHACKRALEESNRREPGAAVFPYAVTKAALIHLVKSLAIIAAPDIRVNCVSPGVLLTDWGLSFPPERLAATKEANKLKTFATVEDVAEQVRTFVVSRTITGQNGIIDAGFGL